MCVVNSWLELNEDAVKKPCLYMLGATNRQAGLHAARCPGVPLGVTRCRDVVPARRDTVPTHRLLLRHAGKSIPLQLPIEPARREHVQACRKQRPARRNIRRQDVRILVAACRQKMPARRKGFHTFTAGLPASSRLILPGRCAVRTRTCSGFKRTVPEPPGSRPRPPVTLP